MRTMYSTAFLLASAVFLSGAPAHAVTDSAIEEAVKDSFVFRHFLKKEDIRVKSSNGAVTLTGTVSAGYRRSMAEETVNLQSGVKSVNNRLTVGDREPERSDGWLTAKVKSLLMLHRGVSGTGTEVETKDGVVTLRGRAENASQKQLAGEYAKDVDGVKDVKNEMTVADAARDGGLKEKIDNASVAVLVKNALLFHRSTSALNTSVTANDGKVTLTGKARSEAEKDLATRIAKDVRGVRDVDNQMIVTERR